MKQNGERRGPGQPAKNSDSAETIQVEEPKSLEDLGISYDQSSRRQGMSKLPERGFEERGVVRDLATRSSEREPRAPAFGRRLEPRRMSLAAFFSRMGDRRPVEP
jgi:hypothetical protein